MRSIVTERPPDSSRDSHADSAGLLRELYERYGRSIYGIAYRLTGSEADAEDVLHDVFVGLPEALGRYHEEGRMGAWLRRVAARVALTRLRVRRRRSEVALEADVATQEDGHSERTVDRVTLEQALAALPEPLRTVLILKDVEGFSHAEIAQTLGIRIGTSQVRLHRAHKKLREQLEKSS